MSIDNEYAFQFQLGAIKSPKDKIFIPLNNSNIHILFPGKFGWGGSQL